MGFVEKWEEDLIRVTTHNDCTKFVGGHYLEEVWKEEYWMLVRGIVGDSGDWSGQ